VHSPGVLWAGLVRSRALPWRLPAAALPDGACPPVGRLGLTAPPSSVLCTATTALCPSRGTSLVARRPDTLPAARVRGLPRGTRDEEEAPGHARACGRPVPQAGTVVKETGGSPTFPAFPLWLHAPLSDPAGGLDPRHNAPRTAAYRPLDSVGFPLHTPLRDILVSTTRRMAGRHHTACILAPPGSVRPLTGRHAGALLTGWLDVSQGGLAPTGQQQPVA
jgi:hypothetical protein